MLHIMALPYRGFVLCLLALSLLLSSATAATAGIAVERDAQSRSAQKAYPRKLKTRWMRLCTYKTAANKRVVRSCACMVTVMERAELLTPSEFATMLSDMQRNKKLSPKALRAVRTAGVNCVRA
jgi:hypothetical protein